MKSGQACQNQLKSYEAIQMMMFFYQIHIRVLKIKLQEKQKGCFLYLLPLLFCTLTLRIKTHMYMKQLFINCFISVCNERPVSTVTFKN